MNDDQAKEQRREERLRRDAERFRANIAIPRPGTKAAPTDLPVLKRHGVELSDLLYVEVQTLRPNPLNTYPPLAADEMAELVEDIKEKGVLVPLITKTDGTIVCGHNRHAAAMAAGLHRLPVQRILSPLTDALEQEIMKSENDRRRGGNWTREKKEQFIREHFAEAITEDRRGGDRKSGQAKDQKLISPLIGSTGSLAAEIEKKSRGRISRASAKEIVTGMRRGKQVEPAPAAGGELPEKDRKRGEKLALQLKTIRQARAMLEKKLSETKAEESRLVKALKTIGQPELFLKPLTTGADR